MNILHTIINIDLISTLKFTFAYEKASTQFASVIIH